MTLSELVSVYDGDVLFSVREIEANDPIISFKNGEEDALKESLLARTIDAVTVEVNVTKELVTSSYSVVMVVYLTAETTDETTEKPTEETA